MNYLSFLSAAVEAGTPLLFATLGVTITEKSGNLNLGVEGMMLLGAVIGFQVGLLTSNPVMAMAGAMVAGGLGALIYAFLTVTLRANQIVSGLSLTIFGTGISSFLGQKLVGHTAPDTIKTFFKPFGIPLLRDLPAIGQVFFYHSIFVYLGYLLTVLLGVYLYRTRKGLNLRITGENPAAADASGINVSLYKYIHIILGGALCGLGGVYLSIVYVPAWQENVTAGRGWIAVALVIFAVWNPYKALFGAYFFGGLDILAFYLPNNVASFVSRYFIDMLPYIITILVLVISSVRQSKDNLAPKSLGEPYFREDR